MITIEHLEVLFDAERDKDEAMFAALFREHIERYDQDRRRQRSSEKQAHRDRRLDIRSTW
jgi:hypothetical protein